MVESLHTQPLPRIGNPTRKTIPKGQLLIGGKWVDAQAGETMEVLDPTTESVITQVQKASAVDANLAIDTAHAAFEDGRWGRMCYEDRAKILFKMADLGMPYTDFRNIVMPHCSGLFRFYAGQAMAHMDGGYCASYESNIRILTRREPLGVVGAITSWHFPLALTASKVATGLAAGNCIIHKPASDTPLTALALAQVALDAGVPDGVYNLIKILKYIDSGKASTAHLTAGGGTRKIDGKGLFIEATVFADATNDLKISREEIFGPVVPVIPFAGEDEAIRLANDTDYGLASGIQTSDLGRALRLADRIKAGTVWLNTWHKYHPNAPFGGYKASGYGREQGAEALENYTQYKTIWANLG